MSKIGSVASRASGELAIIVIGVLIALWADGLADTRSERRDLKAHLQAVNDEPGEEVEPLAGLKVRLEREATALRSLAAIGTSGNLPPDSTLIALVYGGILDVTLFEPSLTALDDLQTSGLVPLVRDLELRLALSRFRQSMRSAAIHAEVNRTGPQQQIFDPFVLQELSFVWRSLPAIQDVAPWNGPSPSWEPLFNDRGRAIVTMRYDLLNATVEDWDRLRGEMDRLIALIEADLASW